MSETAAPGNAPLQDVSDHDLMRPWALAMVDAVGARRPMLHALRQASRAPGAALA